MQTAFLSRHRIFCSRSGGSSVPVILVIAAVAISTVIFFVFTRHHLSGSQPQGVAANQASRTPANMAAADPAPATPPTREPLQTPAPVPVAKSPATTLAPAPAPGFARPLDLATQLVRNLGSGDITAAAKLASAGNPAQAEQAAAVLEKMFKDMGYKVGPDDKIELLGQVENITRLSIPLIKPGDPNARLRLQVDLERDDKMGWKIATLHLPKDLGSALAALPQTTPAPAGSTPANAAPAAMQKSKSLFAVAETTDALTFANDFVQTLLRHDFVAARKLIDESKVQPQKLAGLCIVFEEGQYELKPAKPLIMTVANPEVSWVIAQVQSETLQQSTEFGLELQRGSTSDEWHVAGLNLSEILGSFAQSASKLGVPYTPLVRNPRGGESLALYFEYDRAELHPRAVKQLEIVAGLLKSDPNRKLNIAGHTDAKGADDYNVRLSAARAESVKKQLVALGVPQGQVTTTAMGKAQPLGPNQKADGTDDPEGRSKNRRAEIFLDF